MKKETMCCLAVVATLLAATTAVAQPNLQITEIFPGFAAPGPSNVTEDWFELTNFGDAPWVFATDGSLFYEDVSADPLTADLMTLPLATEIGVGQSVIFVNAGDEGKGRDDFLAAFPTVDPAIVGLFDGAGLGGEGDTVVVFTGDANPFPDPGISNAVEITRGSYPDQDVAVGSGEVIDGATFDVLNGKWSVEGVGGAFASDLTLNVGGVELPIIGSPGAAVPEPASVALVAAAVVGLAALRIRK